MAGTVLVSSILLLKLAILANGQLSSVPVISNYSALNGNFLPENIPIGATIGKIDAYDPDDTAVTYYITGSGGEYFNIDTNTGVVTLKKLLDFEKENEIKMNIRVLDATGQSAVVDAKVFVNDENDNAPVFDDTGIFETISESENPGTFVAFILVTDRDTKNDILNVTCTPSTEDFRDACSKFRLDLIQNSNKFWRGNITLNQRLDFEQRNSYAILLTAFDGLYSVTNEVHIEVEDVNDSPPRWTSRDPATIKEENPNGTFVQRVEAVDRDATAKRPIRYELVGNNTDVFAINATTGVISNKVRIDYDEGPQDKGVPYDVTIKAREVLSGGDLGNNSLTTAEVTIKVTVEDIDDNAPLFKEESYTAYINENIATNANVPGLQMTVTDIDSGTFNSFDLITLVHDDVFGIIPEQDAASSSATLFVIDGEKIDFETGPQRYIIPVRSVENQVTPALTGSSTVTIIVRDVNDQTPVFRDDTVNPNNPYVRTISELSPADTLVIDLDAVDSEAGLFGTAGIRYKLFGNIPPHFKIDETDGIIRVAACNAPGVPGRTPCIDYERKQQYALTVSATDELGIGRTRSIQVTVNIQDENDNVPQPEERYVRYIYEGETITVNPLRIDADDPDTVGGPLSFQLSGDSTALWQITTQTDPDTQELYGNITAIRPIQFSDAPDPSSGRFDFAVVVKDQRNSITAPVSIIVIDINNNAPVFAPKEFLESIPENTPGNTYVLTVTASDGDAPTTGNGVIDFSIRTGASGKFKITNVRQDGSNYKADIFTTNNATFDYEKVSEYKLELVARDRGSPESKFGVGNGTIRILDVNNRNPRIRPTFQSINVYENAPIGRTVYTVTAEDPDRDSDLRFYMTAVSATDGTGSDVNPNVYDYTSRFRIEAETGNVVVNGPLDRDSTARIRNNLTVEDITPNPNQQGFGTLLIHILEYNDQAPQFESPFYNITIDEELNRNSFVLNLNCRDVDDKISGYALTHENPRRAQYFTLLPGSGSMIVNDRIDFEVIERIELSAQCTDTGQPALSNTTRIIVNIRNINDNTPVFNQSSYNAKIPEGSASGPLGVRVSATDLDKGDYGVVRYRLEPNAFSGNFTIDEITGEISIKPNATFDRETSGFFGFQVVAYDSPLDATVRKQSSVPVYVQILDSNDNCPVFSETMYFGSTPESAGPETDILDVIATDNDEGENAELVFAMKIGSGNPPITETFFSVNPINGRVSVARSLKGLAGTYYFNITATDTRGLQADACTTEVPVRIIIEESINNAPEWMRPPRRDYTIDVLESQYRGMPVYNAHANDTDRGQSGIVEYYFVINTELGSTTPEFNINRVTGVIRAEIVYDREQRDSYFLTLMARDRGNPAASSETTLTVRILDVDDNDPIFPMRNGQVIPLVLNNQRENVMYNQSIGRCSATDADSDHENNRIYYRLLTYQDEGLIHVDENDCSISLLRKADFENTPSIRFEIEAYNKRNNDAVKRYRREVNPSILPVVINFQDENDNPPVFTQSEYFACVSVDAPFKETVLELSAVDKDLGDSTSITYSLNDPNNAFTIDPTSGIISNIISFNARGSSRRVYRMDVSASDGIYSSSAVVYIFVTSPSNTVKLKVNKPLTEVEPFSQQLVKTVMASDSVAFACIDEMRNHHDDDGNPSLLATDVYMTAVRKTGTTYTDMSGSDLVNLINNQRDSDSNYQAIGVTEVEEKGDDDGISLDEPAVLAILIICILLIFLALVLFCLACYCIRDRKEKEKRKLRAERHAIVQVANEPVETSFNPVYQKHPEDEYAVVQKTSRPGPITPVVIPSPEHLEPLGSEEPKHFEPVEPQANEPVIETEVVDEVNAGPRHEEPRPTFEPEFEDRIETEVVDEPVEDVPVQISEPIPEPLEDEEIEVSIRGDSLPPSPPESARGSPRGSPPNQSPRGSPPNQSPRGSPLNQSPQASPRNQSPRSSPPESPRYARDSD